MGAEILIPLAVVIGVFILAFAAVRWAMAAQKGEAKSAQKLEDLAQISRSESDSAEQLTKPLPNLDRIRARWRARLERIARVRGK